MAAFSEGMIFRKITNLDYMIFFIAETTRKSLITPLRKIHLAFAGKKPKFGASLKMFPIIHLGD
ncbi:MAG: hypothetical protein HQL52_08695 [Magnetococcales bacterium]|nr:hypothetical protein [Magnetococcales bacterium]